MVKVLKMHNYVRNICMVHGRIMHADVLISGLG